MLLFVQFLSRSRAKGAQLSDGLKSHWYVSRSLCSCSPLRANDPQRVLVAKPELGHEAL